MANFALADILEEIDNQASQFGVNPRNAKAIVIAENTGSGSMSGKTRYDGSATSPVGASGIMQVMPATARGLQQAGFLPASWKHDPEDLPSQVAAGLAAMKEKSGRMKNPDDLGELASVYNGSSRTHRAYKEGRLNELPTETTQYIQKLRRASMELDGLDGSGRATAATDPRVVDSSTAKLAGSSSRTTTTSRTQDPFMLDAMLGTIMDFTGVGGQADQAARTINNSAATRNGLVDRLVDAVAAKGAAAGEFAMAEATTLAAGQAKRAATLASLNLNPTATANEMIRARDAIYSTEDALVPKGAELDKRMAVGFFDNPFEWLVNQTRLPGMVEEYNGIVGVQKNALQRYESLAKLADTDMKLNASTEADLVLKSGVAKSKAVAADAVAETTKVLAENAGATVRDQLMLAQLTGQRLQMQASALATSRESVTNSEGISARDQAKQDDKLTLDGVNAMIISLKGEPLTPLQFKQLETAKRGKLMTAATTRKYGDSFSDSFEYLRIAGNDIALGTSGGAGIVTWINAAKQEAMVMGRQEAAMQKTQGNRKYDEEKEFPRMLDAVQKKYQEEATGDMSLASKSNPLKLDYALAIKWPELQNNVVTKFLQEFGPGGKTPTMEKVSENLILQRIATSVGNGAVSAADAAKQVSDFYRISTENQAKSTNAMLFGLVKPTTTYQVSVSRDEYNLKLRDVTDLGNASQVERALTLQVIGKKANEIQNLGLHQFGMGS